CNKYHVPPRTIQFMEAELIINLSKYSKSIFVIKCRITVRRTFRYVHCLWKYSANSGSDSAINIKMTPLRTEEKKFHVLSTIERLYVSDLLSEPSYRIIHTFFYLFFSISCFFAF